jgi:hypothetical protein
MIKVNSLFLWADVHEIPFLNRFGSVFFSFIKLTTRDKPCMSVHQFIHKFPQGLMIFGIGGSTKTETASINEALQLVPINI